MAHRIKQHQDRIERAQEAMPGEQILTAWQLNDPRLQKDALNWWRQSKILPAEATIQSRLEELAAVGYVNDEFAGTVTAVIGQYEPLHRKFAFLRISVVPAFRLNYLQIRLSAHAHEIMEALALERPDLNIAGIAVVREAAFQPDRKTPPVSPSNKTVLVGYNKNDDQVRVKWFPHIRV